MQLSENFSLAEYSKSNTAVRLDIDNEPLDEHLESAINLFENVIQPVRDEFGPTRITSGYRSEALNEAIGGSATSQHSKGQACDFECDGTDNKEVVEWIIDNVDFDQLILEFYNEEDPNSGWIHCSFKDEESNRNQVLRALKRDGRTVYEHGL
jgi:hypothetical protein|tara:strand:- start:151 stop:609 length:459 start_codon:yes stop_codon:yes gene_type:complete